MSMVSTCGFRSMTRRRLTPGSKSRSSRRRSTRIGFEVERLWEPAHHDAHVDLGDADGAPEGVLELSHAIEEALGIAKQALGGGRARQRAAMRRGPNTVGAPEGIQHRGLAGGEFHAAGANLLVVDVQRVRIRVRARRRGDGVPPVGRWSATRRGRGRPTRRANDASGVEDACAGARHPGFAAATARRTQGAPTQDAPRATHAPDIAPSAPKTAPRAREPEGRNAEDQRRRGCDDSRHQGRLVVIRRRAPTTTAVDMIKRSSLTNTLATSRRLAA